MSLTDRALEDAMRSAIELAREVEGRTAPNPPVGAVALDASGRQIGGHAHQGAGLPHAEAGLILKLRNQGLLDRLHTMVVTLEPCAHYGRTPPCAKALIDVGAKQVIYGTPDPSEAAGGGHAMLESAGVTVGARLLGDKCDALNAPFVKRVKTGLPYVVIKRAFRPDRMGDWTMQPAQGDKTFTRQSSLTKAHEIRRACDGILTGSGTVLGDDPSFTVRHVEDHPKFASGNAKRPLILMDRRTRVPQLWQDKIAPHFELTLTDDPKAALEIFTQLGCLKILVEAGPSLSDDMIKNGLWDECVDIYNHAERDEIRVTFRLAG